MGKIITKGYDIFLSDNGEYIINIIKVPITLDLMLEIMETNDTICENTGVTKIFSDVRNSRNEISLTNNYDLFTNKDKYKALMEQRARRVAILASIGDNSHYPPETFATNAGFSVKVFFEKDHALNWLMI